MAEKTLNEFPRELRVLFTKGMEALQRDNFDYAIELFNQILSKDPALYDCRKALRMAQTKKAGNGGGMFKKMWSTASSQPLVGKAQLALRNHPAEALQIAEQILNGDPNNAGAHKIVVEAAAALELPKTAVLSLENLAKNSPKDLDVAVKFATALADAGEVSRGEQILADLARQFPANQDLGFALKNLSARKTMRVGGYDALEGGKGSYRDILKDKDEAVTLEQENRQVKSEDTAERLINEYETRLKTDPNNLKLLRDLAELYTQKKQFDRALSYYQQIKSSSSSGNDASLDRGIAIATVRKLDHEISLLDQNGAEYPEQLARLQAEKQTYQLAECQKRAERFPTDLGIRFELGQLYFQAGKTGEAIKELQKARGNPHKSIAAQNLLAQCFMRRNMNDMAANALQDAIKEKLVLDEEKKELIYNLGCVLEKMDKKEDAIAQFKIIYGVDAGYRDVEQKIDKYYAGGDGAS
jgi:tetratricopeptide (TPR) repeat protein